MMYEAEFRLGWLCSVLVIAILKRWLEVIYTYVYHLLSNVWFWGY